MSNFFAIAIIGAISFLSLPVSAQNSNNFLPFNFEAKTSYTYLVSEKNTSESSGRFNFSEMFYNITINVDSVVKNVAHCRFVISPVEGETDSLLMLRRQYIPRTGTFRIDESGELQHIQIASYFKKLTEDDKEMMKRYRMTDKRVFALNTSFELPAIAVKDLTVGNTYFREEPNRGRGQTSGTIVRRNDTLFGGETTAMLFVSSLTQTSQRKDSTASSDRRSEGMTLEEATLLWHPTSNIVLYYTSNSLNESRSSMYYQRGSIYNSTAETTYTMELVAMKKM